MDALTIRVAKAVQNLSTSELARRAGVERTTAWRWETGKPHVSPEASVKLMRALLAGGPDDPDKAA